MTAPVCDLVVIGGGVMGLFTAYYAAERSARAVVLERGRVGDPTTASYGRTRSFRNDYLDPAYARLAHEAFRLWGDFERQAGSRLLVRCGCLNIGKRAVTPPEPAILHEREEQQCSEQNHQDQDEGHGHLPREGSPS